MSLLQALPIPLQVRYAQWVSILAHNPKNGIRGFAVELCESILLSQTFGVTRGTLMTVYFAADA